MQNSFLSFPRFNTDFLVIINSRVGLERLKRSFIENQAKLQRRFPAALDLIDARTLYS